MSKSLIVYFSHNKENYFSGNIVNLEKGNVQVIAETLSTMIDADIYEIKEVDTYPFDYHECTSRASDELKNNARPQILDPLDSIEEYDTIFFVNLFWDKEYFIQGELINILKSKKCIVHLVDSLKTIPQNINFFHVFDRVYSFEYGDIQYAKEKFNLDI